MPHSSVLRNKIQRTKRANRRAESDQQFPTENASHVEYFKQFYYARVESFKQREREGEDKLVFTLPWKFNIINIDGGDAHCTPVHVRVSVRVSALLQYSNCVKMNQMPVKYNIKTTTT